MKRDEFHSVFQVLKLLSLFSQSIGYQLETGANELPMLQSIFLFAMKVGSNCVIFVLRIDKGGC